MGRPMPHAVRKQLLALAREAMVERASRGRLPRFTVEEPGLVAPRAAFVTLLLDGAVRGCVGTVEADRPLWQQVVEMAAETAVHDPLFPPPTLRELARCDLELTVLGPLVAVAPEAVVPRRHGLYLVRGPRRSVLLPQAAIAPRWTRRGLLEAAALRAGLPADGWREPEVRLFAFEAEVFSESSEAAVSDQEALAGDLLPS